MTAWQRAVIMSIICFITLAGVGSQPTLAALCDPMVRLHVYGRGDALLAYAPLLELRHDGIGSEQLSVLNKKVMHTVRERTKDKDVYSVNWNGSIEKGCAWGSSDRPADRVDFRSFQKLGGTFSFTRQFFDFIDGIDALRGMNFSMTNELDHRTGMRWEGNTLAFDFANAGLGVVEAGFALEHWDLHDYVRTSLTFHKPEGISTIRMSETTFRRPYPGELLPSTAVPFRGGGYSLGARLRWKPNSRMALTYTADHLVSKQWAVGLVHETYTLETNKQFVGVDGYLENRPLAEGYKRMHEMDKPLTIENFIEFEWALDKPVRLGMRYNVHEDYLESFMVGFRSTMGAGQVDFGWDAADHSFRGDLSYPIHLGSATILSGLNFGFDHPIPNEVTLITFGGSLLATF